MNYHTRNRRISSFDGQPIFVIEFKPEEVDIIDKTEEQEQPEKRTSSKMKRPSLSQRRSMKRELSLSTLNGDRSNSDLQDLSPSVYSIAESVRNPFMLETPDGVSSLPTSPCFVPRPKVAKSNSVAGLLHSQQPSLPLPSVEIVNTNYMDYPGVPDIHTESVPDEKEDTDGVYTPNNVTDMLAKLDRYSHNLSEKGPLKVITTCHL